MMIRSRALFNVNNSPARIHARCMHLLHQMFTKDPMITQLESIRKRAIPPGDQLHLQLRDTDGKKLGIMTLAEALQHLKPLFHLSPQENPHLSQQGPAVYQIKPLQPSVNTDPYAQDWEKTHRRNKAFKRAGRSKDMPLMTVVTPARLRFVLSTAYGFLLRGARVEFRLGRRTQPSDKEMTVDWAFSHALHLRPDTIMAAMPPGTTMLAQPCHVEGVENVLMWAFEYGPGLEAAKETTPKAVKRLGEWGHDEAGLRELLKGKRVRTQEESRKVMEKHKAVKEEKKRIAKELRLRKRSAGTEGIASAETESQEDSLETKKTKSKKLVRKHVAVTDMHPKSLIRYTNNFEPSS